jgi:hypothetical protein
MHKHFSRLQQNTSHGLMWLVLLLLGSSMLVGCSQQLQRQTCVALADKINYCLAPVANTMANTSISQQVTFSRNGVSHQLITELQIDDNSMTLVGLAPLGQALFSIVYDGQSLISQQSSLLGDQFKAEYLMAIMQLVYWPSETVNNQLSAGVWQTQTCGTKLCSQLIDTDTSQPVTIISVEYSQHKPWLANIAIEIKQADVNIMIQTLQ